MTLRLTGITPNGNKIYQALEDGVRTILTKQLTNVQFKVFK